MKKLVFLLVILMLKPFDTGAQDQKAKTRFYEGVVAEEVTGDLDKALTIYRELLKNSAGDRQLAARCLYHIGLTYEKKGSDKALGYYADLLEKYPDQADLADLARGRISRLKDANTFIDPRDGHKYKWVKIGNQIWMAENLAYMPWVNPPKKQEWGIWVYDYDGEDVAEAKATENYQKYGCLYDWTMAMDIDPKYLEEPWNGDSENHQGICPPGWHLPTDGEWKTLEKSLGMSDSLAEVLDDTRAGDQPSNFRIIEPKSFVPVGKYLKSASGWYRESNGDNSSGLSLQPAGVRNCLPKEGIAISHNTRNYDGFGYSGVFWTSTESQDTTFGNQPRTMYLNQTAFTRSLHTRSMDVSRNTYSSRGEGVSVRCLKDDDQFPIFNKDVAGGKYGKIVVSPTVPQEIAIEKSITPVFVNKFILPAKDPKIRGTLSIIPNEDRIYVLRTPIPIIYALDSRTLDTIWTHQLKANSIFSMVESKEFILCETPVSIVGIRKVDGKQVWQIGGADGALQFSRIANEILFIQIKGFYYAINVNSGEEIWNHKQDERISTRATFVNDTLYVPLIPSSSGRSTPPPVSETKHTVVEAIDAKTGKSIWEYKFYSQYFHCAYNNGLVMIRGNSNLSGPYLIAINAKTGKKEWATFLGTQSSDEPITVGDSSLFLLSPNYRTPNQLLALDFDGRIKWNKIVPKIVYSINEYPVVFNNKVFFLTGTTANRAIINTRLMAVEATNGSTIYTINLVSEPLTYPIFRNNKMYIGCQDGLYIFEYPKLD